MTEVQRRNSINWDDCTTTASSDIEDPQPVDHQSSSHERTNLESHSREIESPAHEDLEKGQTKEDEAAKPQDPNLVTWDGLEDPTNPKNWTFNRKWLATGLVSLITFMTPIASSMIAPAEEAINEDLDVHSTIYSELIFSIFLLAFVFGPLLLAPLSELYGRMVVLQLSCAWFLVFNLACGFARTLGQMLAFRFLAGLGACAPQTIGGGVLSDLWTADQRGMAVGLYTLGPTFGPALGPLIGAWITEKTTWRWSFWAVTIFGACVQTVLVFTLKETYGPRLLQLKAQKLRLETGNQALHTEYEREDRRLQAVLRHALIRVFLFLATQPIVQFLALYMALVYGIIYLILATFPQVWTEVYHESTGIGGLNYISLMIGLFVGAQSGGYLLDVVYRRLKARNDGNGRPEYRVPPILLATFLIASGLFMYGWSAQAHTHWIVPNIGATIFSAGINMSMTALQSYTIDCYPIYAASAIGATAVARSMTGFSFPLFATYMYDALGWGWSNSILAFAILVIGYGGSLTLWFYGDRLRAASKYTGKS